MSQQEYPADEAFMRQLAEYSEIRKMNPVIETARTIADDMAQRLSEIGSITTAHLRVYTDEENAYFDSLGSHPAD